MSSRRTGAPSRAGVALAPAAAVGVRRVAASASSPSSFASRPSETLGTARRIGGVITTRLNCATPPEELSSLEQRNHNPRVGGSSPSSGTTLDVSGRAQSGSQASSQRYGNRWCVPQPRLGGAPVAYAVLLRPRRPPRGGAAMAQENGVSDRGA